MRTHFNLPDGTTVYLNSGSSLSYPSQYDNDERRVYLSGEAYFNVAHDADVPFIVSALDNKYNVRILGTEFNVQAYDNDNIVSTTLVNGSVNLEIKSSEGIVINKKLLPSEKAIFNLDTDEISVVEADTEFDTAWMDGKLMLENTSFREFASRLENHSGYTIKYDARYSNIPITAKFIHGESLEEILNTIKIILSFNYKIDYKNNTVYIYK